MYEEVKKIIDNVLFYIIRYVYKYFRRGESRKDIDLPRYAGSLIAWFDLCVWFSDVSAKFIIY